MEGPRWAHSTKPTRTSCFRANHTIRGQGTPALFHKVRTALIQKKVQLYLTFKHRSKNTKQNISKE